MIYKLTLLNLTQEDGVGVEGRERSVRKAMIRGARRGSL